jgi:hypothetical protein
VWGAADEGVLRRINSLELLDIFKIQKTAIDVPGEVKTRTLHQMQTREGMRHPKSSPLAATRQKNFGNWYQLLRTMHQLSGRGTCVRFT